MSGIGEFITACLDERERDAREMTPEPMPVYTGSVEPTAWLPDSRPRRALHEVAVLRAVAALHKPLRVDYLTADGDDSDSIDCGECDTGGVSDTWPCQTIRLVASIWQDWRGYDPAWKP